MEKRYITPNIELHPNKKKSNLPPATQAIRKVTPGTLLIFVILVYLLHLQTAIIEHDIMEREYTNVFEDFLILAMKGLKDLWKGLNKGATGLARPSSGGLHRPQNPLTPPSPLPPTQQITPPISPETQQTRDMGSVIGRFTKKSRHYAKTLGPDGKVQHGSMVSHDVQTNPTASHAFNNVTSKKHAYKVDSRVTEVAKIAEELFNGIPKPQYIAIKDEEEHITNDDMDDFEFEQLTPPQADEEFQKIIRGNSDPIFRNPTTNVTKRYNPGEPVVQEKKKDAFAPKHKKTKIDMYKQKVRFKHKNNSHNKKMMEKTHQAYLKSKAKAALKEKQATKRRWWLQHTKNTSKTHVNKSVNKEISIHIKNDEF